MSLLLREPFQNIVDEVDDLRRSMNRLFGSLRGDGWRLAGMPVDVYETRDEVVVRADLPGVTPEEVNVNYRAGELTIRAERKLQRPGEAAWRRQDRVEGELVCTVSISAAIDPDSITATEEHGVLTVRMAKREEAPPKQIPVQSGH